MAAKKTSGLAVHDLAVGYYAAMMRRAVPAAVLAALAPGLIALAQTASAASAATPAALPAHHIASPAATPATASLAPGTIIKADNAGQFANYLPAAAALAVAHGFQIQVTPTQRLQWSAGFEDATEKYSPQVALDKDDYITNYVAGMPFPLIDTSDPKAAVKIAYNWHMGPVVPDDFAQTPWTSNGYLAHLAEPDRIFPSAESDYACEQFKLLRFAHRTEVDPIPTLGENGDRVEWKEKCTKWSAIATGATETEGAGIWVRYLDPRRSDDFYSFSEESRRLRRMTIDFPYPNRHCRDCHQPYWAYALPKTEAYAYRLLGTTALLACMNARDEPAGIVESGGDFKLTEEPFQLRRAYIIEMTPSQKDIDSRILLFIDSEIYVWVAAEFYEGGERVATAIPLWRMHPSPAGGNLFHLAGCFYFPSGKGDLFRSLVPAHFPFDQKINSGVISESEFNPNILSR